MLKKGYAFLMVIAATILIPGVVGVPLGKSSANAYRVIPQLPSVSTISIVKTQSVKNPNLGLIVQNKEQVTCLAKNIYFEAATQSTAGKLAVAFVTKNRVDSHHFPNSFCDVIYEGLHWSSGHPKRDRCQFSWYCDGMGDVPREGNGWRNSQSIAKWFYDHKDRLMDITDGATHYHANWMEKYPHWSKQYRKNVTIDDHIFYKRSYNF
jgi:spore germination cell wall hydrolase CwlJ-like protein